MNKKQYEEYKNQVEAFFRGEGINCLTCCNENCEPYEDSNTCDCCKRRMFTSWHEAKGYNPCSKEILEYLVCEDCIYYDAYGRLDDMTMLYMEEE